MFSFNQSQNSLTNVSGTWLRSYKQAAKAIIQDDPSALRALLKMPATNVKTIFARCKENAMARLVPALSHLQVQKTNSESVASHETYFENNQGFREAELLITPIIKTQALNRTPINQFLSSNVSSPMFQSVRGFKSVRAVSEGTTPFYQEKRSQRDETHRVNDDILGLLNKADVGKKNELEMLSELLKSAQLTEEDKVRVSAAINGYAAGYVAGKVDTGDSTTSGSDLFSAKGGSSATKENKGGRLNGFWDKINKLATLLVIVVILASLTQVGNLPGLRISRVSHEIAPEEIEVTFDDVKGCDEAKQELQEIVEFLINPDKFSALGGKLPKGCLLVGPPGTGKTLLARAVAGQAGVPFFHAAGAEFDEVLVGQGARRVRDLFKAAKARAPCVIFIDEIDSVGGKRTSSVLHPYANQTINQLLSEMDGFLSNEGVIVLGATNRSDDLDKALLRPGRFDTQVTVPFPDMKGRKEILDLYMSRITHDSSIDVDRLSKLTIGFSGADIENLVNTAAIRAAIDGKDKVTMAEFEYAHDKQTLGTDWKSRVRDKEDLRITAYHEGGHTLVAYFTKNSKPLHKVTIAAKGMSGGHTAFLPEKDTYHQTRTQLVAMMDVSMGGRAAEEIILGKEDVTGGASSDLSMATNIAEEMVKRLGMSDKIGLRVYKEQSLNERGGLLGDATNSMIDDEVNTYLADSYKRASCILKTHRRELDLLADALLKYETLDAEDIRSIIDGKSVAKKKGSPSTILGIGKGASKPSSPLGGDHVFVQQPDGIRR